MTMATNQQIGAVASFTLLSWLGEFVHNLVDLPQLSLLSLENSVPAVISVLLFLAWWRLPQQRTMRVPLLCWAWLNLLGGAVLSIIPFPFWPYSPEQTVLHYAMHVVYGLVQLPLIMALMRQSRQATNLKGPRAA